MIKRFEDVRNWGAMRGIGNAEFQQQYQRFLQEAVEIHDAYINNDHNELVDAIGDTIVTLINLAKTVNLDAEDCLDQAFNVIELRKGLTRNGSFIRYGKLSPEDKDICDEKQGNPGDQYFGRDQLDHLEPDDFRG
jgi:NTP pyrophosphatase (non-canonical NTP hydrolase)